MAQPTNKDIIQIWGEVQTTLALSLANQMFDIHIRPLTVNKLDGQVLHLTTPNKQSVAWLENRLKAVILRALPPDIDDIVFEVARPTSRLRKEPKTLQERVPDIVVLGTYHHQYNDVIKPDLKEYNQATQYYRKKWRPLLGPTLSELVRELRQRCNYQDGRNVLGITYRELAQTIGVSESTIKRALARTREGEFKNDYLKYFIAATQTIKSIDAQGRFRNIKTRFVVYLDDALTPEDQAKIEVEKP